MAHVDEQGRMVQDEMDAPVAAPVAQAPVQQMPAQAVNPFQQFRQQAIAKIQALRASGATEDVIDQAKMGLRQQAQAMRSAREAQMGGRGRMDTRGPEMRDMTDVSGRRVRPVLPATASPVATAAVNTISPNRGPGNATNRPTMTPTMAPTQLNTFNPSRGPAAPIAQTPSMSPVAPTAPAAPTASLGGVKPLEAPEAPKAPGQNGQSDAARFAQGLRSKLT